MEGDSKITFLTGDTARFAFAALPGQGHFCCEHWIKSPEQFPGHLEPALPLLGSDTSTTQGQGCVSWQHPFSNTLTLLPFPDPLRGAEELGMMVYS